MPVEYNEMIKSILSNTFIIIMLDIGIIVHCHIHIIPSIRNRELFGIISTIFTLLFMLALCLFVLIEPDIISKIGDFVLKSTSIPDNISGWPHIAQLIAIITIVSEGFVLILSSMLAILILAEIIKLLINKIKLLI